MEASKRDEILAKEAEREEKMRRRMEREERRRERKKKKRGLNEDEDHDRRIAEEERKLLVAQRKLESIRLLDELLERVKVIFNPIWQKQPDYLPKKGNIRRKTTQSFPFSLPKNICDELPDLQPVTDKYLPYQSQ